MKMPKNSTSLFDDIFRLQNAAPDEDLDPEDLEEGFKASLVEGVDEAEILDVSNLRKKTAIIPDDPKYRGTIALRKHLYSDDEEDNSMIIGEDVNSDISDDSSDSEKRIGGGKSVSDDAKSGSAVGSDTEDTAMEQSRSSEDDASDDSDEDEEENLDKSRKAKEFQDEGKDGEDAVVLTADKSDDRVKGKSVLFQTGIWDDLIKSRIAMQKLVSACNCLPQPDTWTEMKQNKGFTIEARNVHSSVRKLLSALLELQSHLSNSGQFKDEKFNKGEGSDEEITSESEDEDGEEDKNGSHQPEKENTNLQNGGSKLDEEEDDSVDENEREEDDEMAQGGVKQPQAEEKAHKGPFRARHKRKLEVQEVEETLAKRHADFQSFRNDTLSKWDEKTRLAHGKVKSKNFAAFEVPVLKQIEQVLVNRDRLIKRIHQKRAEYKIVGKEANEVVEENDDVDEIEDDDEEVELKLKQKSKREPNLDGEIIDDNDFYHVCLRDLIEMKQNEETDPITTNKQWLEIQRLRNKQKKKVDTRASKGRKIRYNIKEKLKNFTTPFDKSSWSDEQKDDLFKALFGGGESQKDESSIAKDQGFVLGL